jgi:serine/threonine protein kinase
MGLTHGPALQWASPVEPVTPSKRKGGAPVERADEPTNVVRPVGDDTGMVHGEYELARGTRLGEYEIEEALGGGGMGEVFSAVHPKIGKRAAIKVLKKDLSNPYNVERFIDEAKVVNTIGHPNIVDIFAFGEMPDGRCYFVMELLVGETLRERIARGRMGVDEVSAILKPLVRALEAAHQKGVIHRDLKPDNVFLVEIPGEKPTVKLLDFGIAKLAKADHRVEQTKSGVMVGTPQYIAPEQAKGKEIDHRADIYSLGGIVFEMLTGRPPFEADNAMEMVAKHLMEAPPKPSSVEPSLPPEIDALVIAMLAKEPAQRPGLVEVMAVLDRLKAGALHEEPKTIETPPQREALDTPSPPIVPPVTDTFSGFSSEPISGAHTAVEPIVVPLPTLSALPVESESAALAIGKGRGLWIATSVIVLGIAMILSFVLIKVLRGDDATPDARVAVLEADAASEPTAVPIVEPDAALPLDAAVADPDAAVAPPPVLRPDAGVVRPPPPPPRARLVLDIANAGKTIEVSVGKQRFTGRRHLELDLVMNQQVAVEIRSEGRFTKRFTVRPTTRTPVIKQSLRLVELDTMEPK